MSDALEQLLKQRLAQLPAVQADEAFVVAVGQRIHRHRRSLQGIYAAIAVLCAGSVLLLAPLLMRLAATVSTAPVVAQPLLQWAFTSVPMGLAAAAVVIGWAWRRA
jgi:hypothetical protein